MSGSAMAIVGQKETVMPFLATGAHVLYVQRGECVKTVEDLIKRGLNSPTSSKSTGIRLSPA